MKKPAEEYYDNLASVYDQATSKNKAWIAPNYMAERLTDHLSAGIHLLDIGIGTGQLTGELLKKEPNITVTGGALSG